MKKVLIASVLGWIILISWFSSQPLKESTKQTYDFLVKINMAEQRDLVLSSTEEIRDLKHLTRKAAHFGLYFCLGGLIGLSFYGCLKWQGKKFLLASWGIGSLLGVVDEIHQYFIPGRSMLVKDMLIDSAGVLCAVLLLFVIISIYESIKGWRKQRQFFLEEF
jgi:VanZ family protein